MKEVSGQSVVLANGNSAEVDIGPANGLQWMVYQIAISSTSTLVGTASVFKNQRFVCGSTSGNQDSADGSPIPLRSGDTLRIVWNAVSPLAVCTAQLFVEETVMGQSLQQ